MKRSKSVRLVLMGASTVALTACGGDDRGLGPYHYENASDCAEERVFTVDFCYDNFKDAQRMRANLDGDGDVDIDLYKKGKKSSKTRARNGFGSSARGFGGFSFGG